MGVLFHLTEIHTLILSFSPPPHSLSLPLSLPPSLTAVTHGCIIATIRLYVNDVELPGWAQQHLLPYLYPTLHLQMYMYMYINVG